MVMLSSKMRATNVAWLALEAIVALLPSTEHTTGLFEVGEVHSWERANFVMLGFSVMDLVDRNGCMHNLRLNCFAMDNRLDSLVDVMVDVLACH